jgi:hypothetical protein
MKAIKGGKVDVRYFKTYDMQTPLPRTMEQASRNFVNLFEMPNLFYMFCAFALITRNVDGLMYGAAWTYVALRFIHSTIHLSINNLIARMGVYFLSCAVLLFMGALLAMRILQAI